jgi:hypothetical protein
VSSAIEELLRVNCVHHASQLWNVVVRLAQQLRNPCDSSSHERRDRARRRVDHLCAKVQSTTFPAEALLCRAKADELAAIFDLE